jgi:ferredoxin--NADP+ reductase
MDESGAAHGTGRTWELPAQLVVRSVGYRGLGLSGLPFDDRRHVVPSSEGRVLDGSRAVPGLYVAGWIKRGPTGIIGTNKKDAAESVTSMLADAESGVLPSAPEPASEAFDAMLAERGVHVVQFSGWRAVDAAERALGASRGRDRTTIHDRADLFDAAELDRGCFDLSAAGRARARRAADNSGALSPRANLRQGRRPPAGTGRT